MSSRELRPQEGVSLQHCCSCVTAPWLLWPCVLKGAVSPGRGAPAALLQLHDSIMGAMAMCPPGNRVPRTGCSCSTAAAVKQHYGCWLHACSREPCPQGGVSLQHCLQVCDGTPLLCVLQGLVSPGCGVPTVLPTGFLALWVPRVLQARPAPSQPAHLQPPLPCPLLPKTDSALG